MHLVHTMAYAGEKPWHGLGNKLASQAPIETWRTQAGMDWTIEASEVRYITGNNSVGVINAFPEQKVLYRSDTKAPLAVVSKPPHSEEIMDLTRSFLNSTPYALARAWIISI